MSTSDNATWLTVGFIILLISLSLSSVAWKNSNQTGSQGIPGQDGGKLIFSKLAKQPLSGTSDTVNILDSLSSTNELKANTISIGTILQLDLSYSFTPGDSGGSTLVTFGLQNQGTSLADMPLNTDSAQSVSLTCFITFVTLTTVNTTWNYTSWFDTLDGQVIGSNIYGATKTNIAFDSTMDQIFTLDIQYGNNQGPSDIYQVTLTQIN